jgi:hypothetical protein
MSKFDVMYNGHQREAISPDIIDEAIELCDEIISGSDDAFTGGFTLPGSFYGKVRDEHYRRADGKSANIVYRKENIHRREHSRIIKWH